MSGKPQLFDNHGRVINYLRLAVTDRCNLRCFYCMPEEGIDYVPRAELLSYEEMLRLIGLVAEMGVSKIRLTGGEPFIRKGIMDFLDKLVCIHGIEAVNITTNGTHTANLIDDLKHLGINSVNLSLDTLDRDRFFQITRRDYFPQVMETLDRLLVADIPTKINTVVMDGQNIEDIIPMVEMTRDMPITIRFIEEMPFNGEGNHYQKLEWHYKRIYQYIESHFPKIEKLPDPQSSTALNYKVSGFKGAFGIIPAYSRTFCGTCNRIRLTPQGMLKTCLYDSGVFNIRDIMRADATDLQIQETFLQALGNRSRDGFEAEKNRGVHLPVKESMSTIGG